MSELGCWKGLRTWVFQTSKNYPLSEDLIVGKYLKEKIVTFEGLIRAWKKTHNKLSSGEWERKHAMAFLSVETVNKKAIEALIENAMNFKQ
jgi:hypothetical protein